MSSKQKKRVVLLDTHAIIHRAYHALPDFSTSAGEPTGALYGLSAMIIGIIKSLKPDYLIACYDLPGPTFRHEAYDNYKAGRVKADDALISQIKRSRDLIKAFGIPAYDKPGFEADDILGTIVEKLKGEKDLEIIIASGDMDTLQLVEGSRVRVYTLKKGINDTIIYDEKAVLERFGFPPKLLPDYKGLRGDPSDNIIGIEGIGEKTASELIQKFGSIENIYKKLKKDKEFFAREGIKERVIDLLLGGEEEALFSKTLAEIRRDAPIDFSLPKDEWIKALNKEAVEKIFQDLEFKSIYDRFLKVIGEEKEEKAETENIPETDKEETLVALWLINSELTDPNIDDLFSYTRAKNFKEAKERVFAELKEKKLEFVFEEIEKPIIPIIHKMEKYGIQIDQKYLSEISREYHAELSKIEKNIYGVAGGEFNINSPKQLGEVLFDRLKLTAKGLKKTEGGARSTRISELDKLKGTHPIIDLIVSHREIQKLLSTYIDAIPPAVGGDGRLHARFIQAGTTTGRFSSSNPNLQNVPVKSVLGRNVRQAFVARAGYSLLALDYSQIELRIAAILSGDETLIKIFKDGKDVHASVAGRVFGVPEDKVTGEMRRHAKTINFGIIYGMGVNALKVSLGTTRAEAETFYNNYFAKFPKIESYLLGVKVLAKKIGYTETIFGRRRYLPALRSPIPFIAASAERMAINAPIQGSAADVIKIAIKRADLALEKEGLKEKVLLTLQVHDELVYEVKEGNEKKASEIIKREMEAILNDKERNPKKVPITTSVSIGKHWGELK